MFKKDRGECDWSAVGGRGWWETEETRPERNQEARTLSMVRHLGGKALGNKYGCHAIILFGPKGLNCGLGGPLVISLLGYPPFQFCFVFFPPK